MEESEQTVAKSESDDTLKGLDDVRSSASTTSSKTKDKNPHQNNNEIDRKEHKFNVVETKVEKKNDKRQKSHEIMGGQSNCRDEIDNDHKIISSQTCTPRKRRNKRQKAIDKQSMDENNNSTPKRDEDSTCEVHTQKSSSSRLVVKIYT